METKGMETDKTGMKTWMTAESSSEIVTYHAQSSAISLPSVVLNAAPSVASLPLEW